MDDKILLLKKTMEKGGAVLFTGAGFSVPSGIPDFRSAGGVYDGEFAGYPAEYLLSHDCFEQHPELFFSFYKSKMIYPDAKPNAAHLRFARYEQQGLLVATVTQNIDGLHQRAGAKKVYELHGSVERNYCTRCGARYGLDYVTGKTGIPKCEKCGATVRPDVVLYGECLDDATVTAAVRAVARARTLIVAGTSLSVYPAAGLIDYFSGDNLVLVNKSATPRDGAATLVINGDVAEVAKAL